MSWSKYAEFLLFAALLVLVPGPDFAVVTKNALAGGRRRARWTSAGVATSNLVQGTAAVCGLSAVIVRAQPVFETIKWAGVAYLALLGLQAIRSAIRGRHELTGDQQPAAVARPLAGWRQGFLSNITNPKVLVFYLAILPQFLVPGASPGWLLALAWSHAALSLSWLLVLTAGLHQLRGLLARRAVRRGLDVTTGAVLLGFSARLAAERA
ncbi:MAG: LysE family translocator [Nocardiopsaceae bacterium]|jgi:threonine/homoserine/homoserine lactone efflux protein|nr:LysE family translocator [Nocardiopsaceae bacterium]